jgi:hypothetical protein
MPILAESESNLEIKLIGVVVDSIQITIALERAVEISWRCKGYRQPLNATVMPLRDH